MFNFLQIVITILKNIFTFYFLFLSSINTRMNIVCYSYVFKERNRNSRMRVKVERSKNEKQHMIITFDGKSIRGSRASSDEMAGIAKLSSALVSISHPSLLFSFPALLCEFSSLGKPSRSLDSEETLSTIFHARSNDTSGSWKTSIRKRDRVLILRRKYITAYSLKLLEFMMNLTRFIHSFIYFIQRLSVFL